MSIAQEPCKGWIVQEVGATSHKPIGRCQLIRIWEDRTRSSVTLPMEGSVHAPAARGRRELEQRPEGAVLGG